MSDIIQNNLNKVLGDIARPTKFRCMIYIPNSVPKTRNIQPVDIDTYCKAASMPGFTTDKIEIDFKGKTIPIQGLSRYSQEWSCEFYNDEKHELRIQFLNWMKSAQYEQYKRGYNMPNEDRITNVMSVFQLDYELKKSTAVYNFYNVFPLDISSIELNADNISQIETFTVNFSYSHFDVAIIEGPLSANDIAEQIKSTVQNVINQAADFVTSAVRNTVGNLADSALGSVRDKASGVYDYVCGSFKTFLG